MNHFPRSTKYLRFTQPVRFGFGVSGSDGISKGSVCKILERHGVGCTDGSNQMLVYIVGVGERRIHTPDIAPITEKEYFTGALKG